MELLASVDRSIETLQINVDIKIATTDKDEEITPRNQFAGRLLSFLRHHTEAAIENAGMVFAFENPAKGRLRPPKMTRLTHLHLHKRERGKPEQPTLCLKSPSQFGRGEQSTDLEVTFWDLLQCGVSTEYCPKCLQLLRKTRLSG
jgi:hypothetical protein